MQNQLWSGTKKVVAYFIQFLFGLLFQLADVSHGHTMPPVNPAEDLPVEVEEDPSLRLQQKNTKPLL